MNNINNRAPIIRGELGNDALRAPIKAELEEVRHQLQNFRLLDEHPAVELVSDWHDEFVKLIKTRDNQPDLKMIQEQFIEMLIGIVVPVELFVEEPIHIIQFMSKKLTNPESIFYSKPFAEKANQVIADTKKIMEIHKPVPEDLLKQLRETEAKRAKELEKENAGMDKMQALREKVLKARENKANFDVKVNAVGKEILEKVAEVKEKVRLQDHEFAEKNEAILKKVEELKQGAEEVRDAMPGLNREIALNGQELGKIQAATVQLQQNIEQTRKNMEDKKGNWFTQVCCIVASVVVSYILNTPVVIGPNGVMVG